MTFCSVLPCGLLCNKNLIGHFPMQHRLLSNCHSSAAPHSLNRLLPAARSRLYGEVYSGLLHNRLRLRSR